MTKEMFVTALSRFGYPRRAIKQNRRACYWCGVKLPKAKISAIVRGKDQRERHSVQFCGTTTDCLENFLKDKNCNVERIL